MTKTKSTKRALLLSALSLLMCVSMLIGSTFAWFTDSVTSAGNKIQAGTLKIDLELLEEDGSWTSIKDSQKALFDYDKWEPGYTEVKVLRVTNKGTLALKWIAKLVSANTLTDLANVIDVYVNTSVTAYPQNRADISGWDNAGTLADFVNNISNTTYGDLEAGETAYLGLAFKMQEGAGNEYQGMDLGGAFDIMIMATQLTYEEDSFDDQYDVDASYTAEADALKSAMAAANSGDVVEFDLTQDMYLEDRINVPSGVKLIINGNGHTLYMNGTTANGASNNTAIRVENGDIVINDLTLAGKARYALYTKGNTAFVNVTLNNVTTDMTSVGMSPIYHNGKANVTLNDCNLGGAGYYDGGYTDGTKILGGAETYFTVNGGYIGVAVVNANEGGAGSIELNNGATADRIFCYTSVNGTNAIVPEVTVSTDSTATEVVYSVKHAVTLKKLTDEGKNVVLSNDITTTDKLTVKNGAYLDGKGYTIDFGGNFNGYVKAIDVLNGSTIKNLHIANAGRAFGADGCNGDIYLDNISGTNAHYFFNGDTPNGSNAYISNSTLDGWISYGNVGLMSFDTCLLKGETSRFHGICYYVVYGDTEFENCTFDNFYMAMNKGAVNSGAAGSVVTITNCVYVTSEGTVKVTADNFKSLLMGPGDEPDFNRMLNNATIIVDGVTVAN